MQDAAHRGPAGSLQAVEGAGYKAGTSRTQRSSRENMQLPKHVPAKLTKHFRVVGDNSGRKGPQKSSGPSRSPAQESAAHLNQVISASTLQ